MADQKLHVITSYYNPQGYGVRHSNYRIFREALAKRDVPCLSVECVLGSAAPEIGPAADVVVVRAEHPLWQKERLLNLALDRLPASCSKVAWLDCDVLFENRHWAEEAARLLDDYPVIQLFDRSVWLPQEGMAGVQRGQGRTGFASKMASWRSRGTFADYDRHGATGLAWAARRELLDKHHFYDACIVGGGDYVLAMAMYGAWYATSLPKIMPTPAFRNHYDEWALSFHEDVGGRVGHLPGTLFHLWHGDLLNRGYDIRNKGLALYDFNPRHDLRIGTEGTWEWNSSKEGLRRWVRDYFASRREDN